MISSERTSSDSRVTANAIVTMGAGLSADLRHICLIEQIGRRDEGAFEELYRMHSRYVFNLSQRILTSRVEAEEIVQDVFFELWRSPPQMQRGVRSLLAWVTTVTKYRCWQQLRRRRRLPMQVDFDLHHVSSKTEKMLDALLLDEVESLTENTSSTDRELFRLMYREDLGATEISRLQAIPVITVRKRILSLHKRLRVQVHAEQAMPFPAARRMKAAYPASAAA